MKTINLILAVTIAFIALSNANGQTTAFSYQGNLKVDGSSASGTYDFEFLLFDSLTIGNQIGSTVSRNGVSVSNGVFSVNLDFGSQFPGTDRFLEIHVRAAGGGSFTSLSPRQLVNSSPYAIKSISADTAVNATSAATAANATNAVTATDALQLGGVAANQYVLTGDARLSDARDPLPGSSNYIQNGTSQQSSSNFNISGTGTANILNAGTQFNIGGFRILASPTNGNLFGGFGSGAAITTGGENTFFGNSAGSATSAGSNNSFFGSVSGAINTGSSNTFIGMSAGNNNSTGNENAFFGKDAGKISFTGSKNTFIGTGAGVGNGAGNSNAAFGYSALVSTDLSNASAIGNCASATQNNSLVLGSIQGVNCGTAGTNVGIGTTAPTERLHVVGNATISGNVSASLFNANNQFSIGGSHVLSKPGTGNIFVGPTTGPINTGANNTFIGDSAGAFNNTGGQNAFVGYGAGGFNNTGSGNTAIGYDADVGSSLVNAAAIGSRAAVTQSNSLVLGSINGVNSATADTNVGIGTTAPSQRFHVVGNGLITGNLTVNGNILGNLPSGSGSYIQNGTSQQATSNFNISGTGTANILNAGSQYHLFGQRLISANGQDNLFVGIGAGTNVSGTDNAFFGSAAGFTTTNGSANAFFGSNAGTSNTTGGFNSFFGASSGLTNANGSDNAFFGYHSGISNTSGNSSTLIGRGAGSSVTTGSSNTFVGRNTGLLNTTGSSNSLFGAFSRVGSSNLVYATAIGADAAVNTSNTIALGRPDGADTVQIPGILNVASQYQLGGNRVLSVAGTGNVFVGVDSGIANTTGLNNAFFGKGAGAGNTAGFSNSFFGFEAGKTNTVGVDNAFFGLTAGFDNQDGDSNSFFGSRAGDNNTVGNLNTFIGKSAGTSSVSGSNNTAIGAGADFLTGALTFATAVGAGAVVSSSNTVQLGRNDGSDTVEMFGKAKVRFIGTGGTTQLCRNGTFEIATCSSSIRYKSNINTFSAGLALVKQLQPVTFNWKAGGMRDMGLVAEEVAKAEPLLTTNNEKGEVEGVKYDRVGVVLINAVKEQQAQIESQLQIIQEQQKQIDSLKKAVCELRSELQICKP